MMNYLYIGAIVGTIITIERLIYNWREFFADKDKHGKLYTLGLLIGIPICNLINIALWPVELIQEVKEFIGMH